MRTCIVVGSGIAGIASSIRLSKQGYKVTVYEANAYAGGKLSEFKQGAYRFDAGPSLFTMPMFVDELFELCGENPRDHFNYTKLNEGCHYFYEDGTRFNCPSNPDKFADMMNEQLGEDKQTVLNFLNKSAKMYEITKPVFLENSLHKISTYLNRKGLKGILNLWRLNMFSTMYEANSKIFKNQKTIQFFNRFATYNGSNPYKAPATLNIIPHLEFGYGTYFPEKGMVDITNSLVALAERQGVKFEYNKKVEEILIKDNKVCGVRVDGSDKHSDLVLSNMDISPTYKYLLPNVETPKRVKQVESSSSALIFYWGVSRAFPELDLHNIFFSGDYEQEFSKIFKEKSVGADPTVYVNISSKYKKDDAPTGCENWFVMVNVPANEGQDWDTIVDETRKNTIAKLSRLLGVDLKSCIANESILDPRSIESKTSSFRGALYGSSSNHMMSAFFRHANFSGTIEGLYFCGGSVHPGGGIPLCLLSAKIVSGLVKAQ
jgi:phytoene desaturase